MNSRTVISACFIPVIILGFFLCGGCGGGRGGGGGGGSESPDTTLLSGTMLDSRGDPVGGASVVIESGPLMVFTDSAGGFSVAVAAGDHHLTITKGSHVIYSCTLSVLGTGSLAIGELSPDCAYYPGGVPWYQDVDGDGFSIGLSILSEFQETGFSLGSVLTSRYGDCDDTDGGANPGATEVCNGKDDDCDGSIDDIGCSPILLVDDDNGLNNGYGIAYDGLYEGLDCPDVDHIYAADLRAMARSFDLFRVMGQFGNGPNETLLKKYQKIVWFTGKTFSDDVAPATLTNVDRSSLSSYLDSGGTLLLSGQDVLWDMARGMTVTEVEDPFANNYLGVLTVGHDAANLGTTYGVPANPVSAGLAISGVDNDRDGYIDTIPKETQVDLNEWGHISVSYSGSTATGLIFTPLSTTYASTVFSGPYEILSLTDDELFFGGSSFWAPPDGCLHVFDNWYSPVDDHPNRYNELLLNFPGHYQFWQWEVFGFDAYPDTLNSAANPAFAQTLLVDANGKAVALGITKEPFKVVFMAFPLEGLWPENDRRDLLGGCLDWLGGQSVGANP